jgi:AcrR family transcriptional regulator
MRTGGEQTRKKILEAAERQFSKKGFDATSVGAIAKEVGINKGLIYYHFADKDDIIISLFKDIVDEVTDHVYRESIDVHSPTDMAAARVKIKAEIRFMEKHRKILSLMLMEALKDGEKNDFLFRCAEIIMNREMEDRLGTVPNQAADPKRYARLVVYEFFTGFIPIVACIALRERMGKHFNIDTDTVMDAFLDAFEASHMSPHFKDELI